MNQSDMAAFLRGLLPRTWFPDDSPILDGILLAVAGPLVACLALLEFVRQQGRLATATGVWLDMAALDYLGSRIYRRSGESDAMFRLRILREILRAKATRQALSDALHDLTGYRPLIFEPRRAADTGGWNTGPLAYGTAGAWGSRSMPYQTLVTAYRPLGEGPPGISGWDCPQGGWGIGSFALQSRAELERGITDDVIREAVNTTITANTVVWLRIRPPAEAETADLLDTTFVLDVSRLS